MNFFKLILISVFLILPSLISAQSNQPKTVREFFNILPEKYFFLEGCNRQTDKNCQKARAEYLQNFLEVEDTANGYLKGGCDGAQSCLTMALFKRSNGTYIVGVMTEFERVSKSYFLEYKGGKWLDISNQTIPSFSKNNYYELPQKGTTIKVFKKIVFFDSDITEKGEKLYDLVWKNGKFSIKK